MSAGCVYAPLGASVVKIIRCDCRGIPRAVGWTKCQPRRRVGLLPALREFDLRQVKQTLVKIFKGLPQRKRLDQAIFEEAA